MSNMFMYSSEGKHGRTVAAVFLLPIWIFEGICVAFIMGLCVPIAKFKDFRETGKFELFN